MTTHYIEETRRADTVAFLRNGRLLAESCPQLLMNRLHKSSLESVFYSLASREARSTILLKQYNNQLTSNYSNYQTNGNISSGNHSEMNLSKSSTMWLIKLICVSKKVHRQTFRQSNHLALQFILPLVSLMLFCCCIGTTPKNIAVGVVNNESPALLSALYLQQIDESMIHLIHYETEKQAAHAVASQYIWGYLLIHQNYSESLIRRAHFQETSEAITNETIHLSTIHIHADITNKVLSVTMMRSLESSFIKFLRLTLISLEYNSKLADLPVKIGQTIYGSDSDTDYFALRDYGIPGFLIVLIYSSSFASSVLSLVSRDRCDLMDRNIVSGVTASHMVTAQIAARLPSLLILCIVLLIIAVNIFSVPIEGSILVALVLLLLQSVAGLTHGLLVSAFCSGSFFSAMVASNFLLLAMFILSGSLWPLDSLPVYLRYLSNIQPTTFATIALRSVLTRASGVTSAIVLQGLISTVCWICAFFAASITLFRVK